MDKVDHRRCSEARVYMNTHFVMMCVHVHKQVLTLFGICSCTDVRRMTCSLMVLFIILLDQVDVQYINMYINQNRKPESSRHPRCGRTPPPCSLPLP